MAPSLDLLRNVQQDSFISFTRHREKRQKPNPWRQEEAEDSVLEHSGPSMYSLWGCGFSRTLCVVGTGATPRVVLANAEILFLKGHRKHRFQMALP